jgi:hypothetical protein
MNPTPTPLLPFPLSAATLQIPSSRFAGNLLERLGGHGARTPVASALKGT